MSAPTIPTTNRFLALAGTEVKLLLRNRTVAVSAVVVPVALGLFWALSFGTADPLMSAMVVALQLANVLGMAIYVTATQTVVARRHTRVLKRMRTSGLTDAELLAATVAPSVVLGLLQLVVFAVIDVAAGMPLPTDPLALLLAILGGLALVVTAALATTVVTPSPERAQITTLPLVFVLLGAAIVVLVAPSDGWWEALVAVPGVAVAQLAELAFSGGTWASGPTGLPAAAPALLALVVWPVVFGVLARRHFRWDPR